MLWNGLLITNKYSSRPKVHMQQLININISGFNKIKRNYVFISIDSSATFNSMNGSVFGAATQNKSLALCKSNQN